MYDYAADVNMKRPPTALDLWPENGDSALQCSAESFRCTFTIQHCSFSDFHFKTNMTLESISCDMEMQ